jgi:hypothetical protein
VDVLATIALLVLLGILALQAGVESRQEFDAMSPREDQF